MHDGGVRGPDAPTQGSGTRPDPSPALVAAFEAAAQRMAGLPVVNPALRVQAVGFAPWEGHWLGVMVTPWCMNLLLAPGEPARWSSLEPGAKRRWRFPAGAYEFIGARDPGFGEYQICSLFSPMDRFADHAAACEVARLARAALLDASLDASLDAVPAGPVAQPPAPPAEQGAARPSATAPATAQALTKRDFLRGRRTARGGDAGG